MNKPKYGIQGGPGSFNEEALLTYLKSGAIMSYQIVYLYTTDRVLDQVSAGIIDFGLFAICNSTGGIVKQSLAALGKYRFTPVTEIVIPIKHSLMIRKDVSLAQIKTVMAHPQVFIQCRNNVAKKYPNLKCIEGTGDMEDTAVAARALAEGKLESYTAILGPRILAEMYNFDIIEDNLQDQENNMTTFLLVKKYGILD